MAEDGNGRSVRNSTGKLKAKAKGPDEGPNYLRASTGSCHDFCKYGIPHEFKPKPKRPVRRSSMSNAEIPIEIFTPSDKRSAKAVKPSSISPPDAKVATIPEAAVVSDKRSAKAVKPSSIFPPDAKVATIPESAVVSGRSSTSKSLSQQASASSKIRSSQVSKQTGEGVSALIKGENLLGAKPMLPDPSNLAKKDDVKSLSADFDSLKSVDKKGSSSQRRSSTSALKLTVQDSQSRRNSSLSNVSGISVASKPTSSKTSVVGRKASSLDASKSVKPLATPSTVKAPLKKTDTSTKAAGSSSLKSRLNRATTEKSSSSNLVASKIGSKIGNESRTSMKTASTTASLPLKTVKTQKSLASSSVALTPNLPGTKVARLNVRSSITKTEASTSSGNSRRAEASSSSKKPEVPEKTLHMIELETSTQQSPGSFDSLCQSKSAFSSQDAIETNSESEYTDSEVDDTVSSYRRGPGKDGVMENETEGVKLKFRRGKVIDPENEANSPRRLKFKKQSVSEDERSAENEMKVVLRHQDVQEKPIVKLNDVIEEAASKLKETRKSKVKALVGAFESVISLQETKPPPSLSPGR